MSNLSEKQLIDAAIAQSTTTAIPILDKQLIALTKASEIRAKIIAGTATEEDKKAYFVAKTDFSKANDSLIKASQLDSIEAKKLKDDQLSKKLSTLTSSKAGNLTFAKPGDLFEYILRTQALNPYSRERACDIEFMNLLYSVAKDTNVDLDKVKELMTLVKDSVSGN